MTIVLDSGAVSALADDRDRLRAMREAGMWPPVVPCVVLTEALTGDHRRDFHTNHLLKACQVVDIDERTARDAAALRFATSRACEIAVIDAIVVAVADQMVDPVVITSDPDDIVSLAVHAAQSVLIKRL